VDVEILYDSVGLIVGQWCISDSVQGEDVWELLFCGHTPEVNGGLSFIG
jgi:hypothetical protein